MISQYFPCLIKGGIRRGPIVVPPSTFEFIGYNPSDESDGKPGTNRNGPARELHILTIVKPGNGLWPWIGNGLLRLCDDAYDYDAYAGCDGHDRRKFRSQTSDNMDRWKAEQGRGREKRKIRREKRRRERVRRKKMQSREKVGKSRNTVFFQWFVAQEGRKVGSLKRRVRSQLARWEMKNWTPLWREAHFEVKMYKTHQVRTIFTSWDVEKVHAVVARSTRSQNVQNTPAPDHFWQLRCRKSARRCGAKHISKSKCTKHTRCGPLLAVEMSKKCTPLWREAHLEVKMCKTHDSRTTFGSWDVEKVHAVVARSTFGSQNVKDTRGSDPLLEVQISKKCTPLWREAHFEVKMLKTLGVRTTFGGADVTSLRFGSLHYTIHSTTLQYITLYYTPQHYNYNYTTTLHYTPLHSTTLHYTKLHYTTPHYTTLRNTTLHYTTLHYLPLHFTTLHPTTLHYTTTTTTATQLHSTTLHYTKLHDTTQQYTTLHYIPLHSTTLHYITLHHITLNDTAPQIDR